MKKHLKCACCGEDAGRYEQHWNQDTGYGLCADCVIWIQGRGMYTPEEFKQTYGVEGVNYAAKEGVTA